MTTLIQIQYAGVDARNDTRYVLRTTWGQVRRDLQPSPVNARAGSRAELSSTPEVTGLGLAAQTKTAKRMSMVLVCPKRKQPA